MASNSVPSNLRLLPLALLLAACGGGDDEGGGGGSGSQPMAGSAASCIPCVQQPPICIDEVTSRRCVEDANGCGTSHPLPCTGAQCEDGMCRSCPGGCCPDCGDFATCGSESDDGCGHTCGDTSPAADECESFARTLCVKLDTCCSDSDALCTWSGVNGCIDYYTGLWDCVGLWCDLAIGECTRAMAEDYQCTDDALPEACKLVISGEFEILGAANANAGAGGSGG